MRLFLKVIVLTGIVAFVAIQFFQPKKNISEISENHIFKQEQLPEKVKDIFKTSCMNCHSNNTVYLWYDNIAPGSWLVSKDIKKGKSKLNFSEWGKLDKIKKISTLEDIRQELEQKTMPIKPYLLMHKEAKLTDDDRAVMYTWIDKKGSELLKSSIK